MFEIPTDILEHLHRRVADLQSHMYEYVMYAREHNEQSYVSIHLHELRMTIDLAVYYMQVQKVIDTTLYSNVCLALVKYTNTLHEAKRWAATPSAQTKIAQYKVALADLTQLDAPSVGKGN